MRKSVAFMVLLSIAPLTTGCAIAMWGATMAVGAKIQKQQEQKTAPAPQAPTDAERSEK